MLHTGPLRNMEIVLKIIVHVQILCFSPKRSNAYSLKKLFSPRSSLGKAFEDALDKY